MLDTNSILQAILLAVEKAIHTLGAVNDDLFGVAHFVPNAIGTAKEDLMDALFAMHNARSWVKDGMAFDKSTPIEKLPYIPPIDTALRLLITLRSILEQERRYPLPPLNGDENETDTLRQRAIDEVLKGVNVAFEALERVQALDEVNKHEALSKAV